MALIFANTYFGTGFGRMESRKNINADSTWKMMPQNDMCISMTVYWLNVRANSLTASTKGLAIMLYMPSSSLVRNRASKKGHSGLVGRGLQEII